MSTIARGTGVQRAPSKRSTVSASVRGTPCLIAPLTGSLRTSERSSCSSTKYGPSVCAGVRTQVVRATEDVCAVAGLPCALTLLANASVAPPSARSAARRSAENDSSPLVMVSGILIAIVEKAMIVAVVTVRNGVAMKTLLAAQLPMVAPGEVVVVRRDRTSAEQRASDCERQHCFHGQIRLVGAIAVLFDFPRRPPPRQAADSPSWRKTGTYPQPERSS